MPDIRELIDQANREVKRAQVELDNVRRCLVATKLNIEGSKAFLRSHPPQKRDPTDAYRDLGREAPLSL